MTNPARMYQMDSMRRINVAVGVVWGGWTGTAVLLCAKPGDTPRWAATVKDGRTTRYEPLPSASMRRRGAGPAPDAWWPLGDWPDALPAPLPHQPHHDVRFATIGGVAFDATAAAAEMEEAREAARCRDDEPAAKDGLPWWRDPATVTYSAAGSITKREAEGRVMRALYFLSRPDNPLRYRSNAAVLADMMASRDWGSSDFSSPHVPHLTLTLSDTADRMLAALRWAAELKAAPHGYGQKRLAVLIDRARNEPLTFADIGLRMHISPARASMIYDDAIDRIAAIANTGTPELDAIIAATKSRNRAHAISR